MFLSVAVILLPVLAAASNDVLFDTSNATPFYSSTCDDCYEEVTLNSTYRLFDENYNTIYVSSNGFLTFDQGYFLPLPESSRWSPEIMLAPYWSDIFQGLNSNSMISFEETYDTDLLEEATRAIERQIFPGCGDLFEPTSLFIVTWEAVASDCEAHQSFEDDYYDSYDYYHYDYLDNSYNHKKRDMNDTPNLQQKPPESDTEAEGKFHNNYLVNTFQVVMATDGCDTFAIFNYEDIQWIYCDRYNRMLFNAGNGVGFYLNPVHELDQDTNVNQQGRWVYKISESQIRGPGCDILGT